MTWTETAGPPATTQTVGVVAPVLPASFITYVNLDAVAIEALHDDPTGPDDQWAEATDDGLDTLIAVSFFPNGAPPGFVHKGTQVFQAAVRRTKASGQLPSAQLLLLSATGGGVAQGDLIQVTANPPGEFQLIEFEWQSTLVPNPNNVVMRVLGDAVGGGPGVRNTVDIGAIRWLARQEVEQEITSWEDVVDPSAAVWSDEADPGTVWEDV